MAEWHSSHQQNRNVTSSHLNVLVLRCTCCIRNDRVNVFQRICMYGGFCVRRNLFSPPKRGSMFYRRWFVCLSVTMITTNCERICTKFYAKVPRGKGKTKFVFRYDQ